jgi:1,4-alpha-glucan branching enzyme
MSTQSKRSWQRCRTAVAAALGAAVLGCFGGPAQNIRGGSEIVEGGVIFRYYDTDAARVYLVGDFNNWSPRADPLVDENGDGQWTLFINLPPGVYQYKFVVDDTWIPDPRNPERASDGFDGENSVIRVPDQ